jgi:hypothetical protein
VTTEKETSEKKKFAKKINRYFMTMKKDWDKGEKRWLHETEYKYPKPVGIAYGRAITW